MKFGVTKKVLDILDAASLPYELYSEIKANPTVENVQTGVAAYKKSGADYLIAIGGGSSMDTAKAIGIIISNPEFEDVVSLEGVAPTKNKSGCGEEPENGVRGPERYSDCGVCRPGYDVLDAQRAYGGDRYGCADARD